MSLQDERCGGVLVAPDIVLTVAHCASLENQQVNIGAYRRETPATVRFCDRWIPDPLFKSLSDDPEVAAKLDHDFALCRLDKPVEEFGSWTRTAELNRDGAVPAAGDELLVMGRGHTEDGRQPEFLHDVTVLGIGDDDCRSTRNKFVPEIQLCAGHLEEGRRDICSGDSGGPLVSRRPATGAERRRRRLGNRGRDRRNISDEEETEETHFVDTIVGLASYGNDNPCATPGKPAVYSRVSARYDWIVDTICDTLNSTTAGSLCETETATATTESEQPADVCGEHEPELLVTIRTDRFAYETEWTLREDDGTDDGGDEKDPLILRRFFYDYLKYEHPPVCLEPGTCYRWEITDDFGDGICSGFCGFYEVRLDGVVIGEGAAFGESESVEFCAPLPPCTDDPSFVEERSGKGCGWIAEKPDVRCTREGAVESCPSSCDRACLGPCADDPVFVEPVSGESCGWIAEKPEVRCTREGAVQGCPSSCDSACLGPCTNDPVFADPLSGEGCDWIGKKPAVRCLREGATEGCPAVCDASCFPDPSCTDDPSFVEAVSGMGCDWIAKKPGLRCTSRDGAVEGCPATCDPACNGDGAERKRRRNLRDGRD